MSQHSANISTIADSLWRELLRSHLNVATVGVIMMIISSAAMFGLRYYANDLAKSNLPTSIATGLLQTELQESIANLRGWMSFKNADFIKDRNNVWNNGIYPAIEQLKNLKKHDVEAKTLLNTLELELYDLDMWQWLIEDVAQTPGNLPANALVEQEITPVTDNMFSAISAIVDIAIITKDITSLNNLLNIRLSLYKADKHLINFVKHGISFDKEHHLKLLLEIEDHIQHFSFDKQDRQVDKQDKLHIFKRAFTLYQSLAQEAILIRESEDWNVSRYLLASTVLPLEQKISTQLNAISTKEQLKATQLADIINKIGWWIPFITAILLILMLYISYRMAKKESLVFIKPVMELESTKDKITQALSESVKLNTSINRNKRRTQIILESSPVSIITINQLGLIQTFNAAAVRLFGHRKLEVMNKNISQLIPNRLRTEYETYVRHFMQSGEAKFFGSGQEAVALHKDNSELHVHLSITKMNLEGETSFLAMVTDITDEVMRRQKILEFNEKLQANSEELQAQQEELRATNEELVMKSEVLEKTRLQTEKKSKELEEASRYKSEFLANMSHELRTPLNSLLILSNVLAENDEGHLSEDEVESATVIHESGKHLLGLINEILDLSKVEAGKMTVNNTLINLPILSTAIKSRFNHMAEAKQIGFSINIANDVPTEFISDETKLNQILTNLLSNAIKFTTYGEVSLNINYIESSDILNGQEPALTFAIVDSGVGIAKEQHAAVFEAFQQADGSTNRQYGGTGLGLSIAQKFSQLLGSKLELESELGKGSTFTLIVPEHPVKLVKAEASPMQTPHMIESFDAKNSAPPFEDDRDNLEADKSLFLIIEDDTNFARILYECCQQQHAQAIIAVDGETGIHLARTYKVTGIILDYMLPGLNGKKVISYLKADIATQNIPIHIISAMDNLPDMHSFGVIGQLIKPVTKAAISTVLQQLQSTHITTNMELLLIEDDEAHVFALRKLLQKNQVTLSCVHSGKEAISILKHQHFSAIIMDLGLPDMTGFELLEILAKDEQFKLPPVIVHTGKELSDIELEQLHQVTETIVIKSVASPERLQDEVHLFINSLNNQKQGDSLESVDINETKLNGKVVLLVDDDMRNTFALAKVLRKKDLIVHIAPGGKEALSMLDQQHDIDIVLMDIMMPEMDGYEAMGRIRQQQRFKDLPIIALTAKAMTGDKEKCLEAGANDYLTKPVDLQKLLLMMQIWLKVIDEKPDE